MQLSAKTFPQQECIPVGCVPPACCPYLPARTAPGGCTCQGVYPSGGYLPRGSDVPAQGVYLPRGCTCPGGVPAQGVYMPGGVHAHGVYLPTGCTWGVPAHRVYLGAPTQGVYLVPGGVPAEVLNPPCEQNDRQVQKYYLALNFVCGWQK